MTFNPLTILRRRARAKGFGVHSPFAYRFITEVLTERLPYYDYDKLRTKNDRTVYRIAAYFCPTKVYASRSTNSKAIFMACPKAGIADIESCDIAIFSAADELDLMLDAINRQCRIVIMGEARPALKVVKEHMDGLQCGMLFDNADNLCVIVPSSKLPRQNYELKF